MEGLEKKEVERMREKKGAGGIYSPASSFSVPEIIRGRIRKVC